MFITFLETSAKYLDRLQEHKNVQLDDTSMNKIIESHCIPCDRLRADDFDGFYQQRKQSLLKLIATAMGKQVVGEGLDDDEYNDDDEEI